MTCSAHPEPGAVSWCHCPLCVSLIRRSSCMGVKVRQKDGKWYVFINHQGRRKAKCVGDSKRAAEEVKRKLEAKLTLGEFAIDEEKPAVPPLGQYAEQWLGTYAMQNCKESTYTRYAGVVRNHLLPVFGATPLTEITREAIK